MVQRDADARLQAEQTAVTEDTGAINNSNHGFDSLVNCFRTDGEQVSEIQLSLCINYSCAFQAMTRSAGLESH